MQRSVFVGVFCAALAMASAASAGQVCGYNVRFAVGAFCPIRSGAQVCLNQTAVIGPCEQNVKCFGGHGFSCQAELEPVSGPQEKCPLGSVRPRGLICYRPLILPGPPRTPTQLPEDTPTFTPTVTGIPINTATATGTPTRTATGLPTGTATATVTATTTNTETAVVATATETAVATATATALPTGTATATTTNTVVATNTATSVPAATSTNTPPATATATTVPNATSTNTVVATNTATAVSTATNTALATSTATVAAATSTNTPLATNTATVPAATSTNTPVSTNTATPLSTATRTNTPPATSTATSIPVATSTNTAVSTNTATAVSTATRTNTPPATSTATATATNTVQPIGESVCTLKTGSELFLQTQALPLMLTPTGSFTIDCGAPGANGTAACACELQSFGAVVIPAIGDVCVNPAAGCEPGLVDCDGGAPIDVNLNADHDIGDCTTNAGCATACDAHCAALGAGFARQSFGCEGHCQGGSNDGASCARDSECPGGQCPGGEPVGHADTCNCVCAGDNLGDPARVGGLFCNLGTQINVELPSTGSCGDQTATIQLAPVCGGVTTETSTGVINHANNSPTTTIPATGPESIDGANLTCAALASHSISNLKLVGQLGFFDSTLGDIRARNTFVCQ